MTTIASPRPSLTLSSRRTSTSTDTNVRSESSSRTAGVPGQKRNRAALREFYGLKNVPKTESVNSTDTLPAEELSPQSEIDKADFDADHYVQDLLDREGLEGVLKVEAGLLRDIRGFDGEKKALVYDNYSKLIGATDTIRKMRGNMDPLKPAFTTLTPAISHIAQRAKDLSSANATSHSGSTQDDAKADQMCAVQHVLDAPLRLQTLLKEGRSEEASKDWAKVLGILDRWKDVPGSQEVREQCEAIMKR